MNTLFLLLSGITATCLTSGYFTWQAVNKKYKEKISTLENEMVSNHSEIIGLMHTNQELESMIQSVTQHYAKGIEYKTMERQPGTKEVSSIF